MEVGYVKSKDCRGGNRRSQEHDLEYNKRLRDRRKKEKKRRKANRLNRGR